MIIDSVFWWGMVLAIFMIVFYVVFFGFVIVVLVRDLVHKLAGTQTESEEA